MKQVPGEQSHDQGNWVHRLFLETTRVKYQSEWQQYNIYLNNGFSTDGDMESVYTILKSVVAKDSGGRGQHQHEVRPNQICSVGEEHCQLDQSHVAYQPVRITSMNGKPHPGKFELSGTELMRVLFSSLRQFVKSQSQSGYMMGTGSSGLEQYSTPRTLKGVIDKGAWYHNKPYFKDNPDPTASLSERRPSYGTSGCFWIDIDCVLPTTDAEYIDVFSTHPPHNQAFTHMLCMCVENALVECLHWPRTVARLCCKCCTWCIASGPKFKLPPSVRIPAYRRREAQYVIREACSRLQASPRTGSVGLPDTLFTPHTGDGDNQSSETLTRTGSDHGSNTGRGTSDATLPVTDTRVSSVGFKSSFTVLFPMIQLTHLMDQQLLLVAIQRGITEYCECWLSSRRPPGHGGVPMTGDTVTQKCTRDPHRDTLRDPVRQHPPPPVEPVAVVKKVRSHACRRRVSLSSCIDVQACHSSRLPFSDKIMVVKNDLCVWHGVHPQRQIEPVDGHDVNDSTGDETMDTGIGTKPTSRRISPLGSHTSTPTLRSTPRYQKCTCLRIPEGRYNIPVGFLDPTTLLLPRNSTKMPRSMDHGVLADNPSLRGGAATDTREQFLSNITSLLQCSCLTTATFKRGAELSGVSTLFPIEVEAARIWLHGWHTVRKRSLVSPVRSISWNPKHYAESRDTSSTPSPRGRVPCISGLETCDDSVDDSDVTPNIPLTSREKLIVNSIHMQQGSVSDTLRLEGSNGPPPVHNHSQGNLTQSIFDVKPLATLERGQVGVGSADFQKIFIGGHQSNLLLLALSKLELVDAPMSLKSKRTPVDGGPCRNGMYPKWHWVPQHGTLNTNRFSISFLSASNPPPSTTIVMFLPKRCSVCPIENRIHKSNVGFFVVDMVNGRIVFKCTDYTCKRRVLQDRRLHWPLYRKSNTLTKLLHQFTAIH